MSGDRQGADGRAYLPSCPVTARGQDTVDAMGAPVACQRSRLHGSTADLEAPRRLKPTRTLAARRGTHPLPPACVLQGTRTSRLSVPRSRGAASISSTPGDIGSFADSNAR